METIRAALTGSDREEHVFILRQSLELYDTYQSKIAECDRVLHASMAALIDEVEKPAKPLSKARVRTKQVNACESASKVDPCFLGQVNELARRSAFGPHAE
jgi:transposase